MQTGFLSSRTDISRADSPVTVIDVHPNAGGQPQTAEASGFFGADGASFRDVLDAINPLNHIPIVSALMERSTGHKVSTASQLVGGALIGGPIGFVASLASAIFESATGSSPGETALAALTGSEAPTQLASNEASPAPEIAAADEAPAQLAALDLPAAPRTAPSSGKDKAILDLYGTSAASAHGSYQKAQLLPYLRDVNTSQVL